MLDEVAELAPQRVVEALCCAEPVGGSVRSHFGRTGFGVTTVGPVPKGPVVNGDAICSVNPAYGQGMTVTTLDALALRDELGSGVYDLARRVVTEAAKVKRIAWKISVVSDLALPGASAMPTPGMRLSSHRTGLVPRCTETNPSVAEQFWKIINLMGADSAVTAGGVVARGPLADTSSAAAPPRCRIGSGTAAVGKRTSGLMSFSPGNLSMHQTAKTTKGLFQPHSRFQHRGCRPRPAFTTTQRYRPAVDNVQDARRSAPSGW